MATETSIRDMAIPAASGLISAPTIPADTGSPSRIDTGSDPYISVNTNDLFGLMAPPRNESLSVPTPSIPEYTQPEINVITEQPYGLMDSPVQPVPSIFDQPSMTTPQPITQPEPVIPTVEYTPQKSGIVSRLVNWIRSRRTSPTGQTPEEMNAPDSSLNPFERAERTLLDFTDKNKITGQTRDMLLRTTPYDLLKGAIQQSTSVPEAVTQKTERGLLDVVLERTPTAVADWMTYGLLTSAKESYKGDKVKALESFIKNNDLEPMQNLYLDSIPAVERRVLESDLKTGKTTQDELKDKVIGFGRKIYADVENEKITEKNVDNTWMATVADMAYDNIGFARKFKLAGSLSELAKDIPNVFTRRALKSALYSLPFVPDTITEYNERTTAAPVLGEDGRLAFDSSEIQGKGEALAKAIAGSYIDVKTEQIGRFFDPVMETFANKYIRDAGIGKVVRAILMGGKAKQALRDMEIQNLFAELGEEGGGALLKGLTGVYDERNGLDPEVAKSLKKMDPLTATGVRTANAMMDYVKSVPTMAVAFAIPIGGGAALSKVLNANKPKDAVRYIDENGQVVETTRDKLNITDEEKEQLLDFAEGRYNAAKEAIGNRMKYEAAVFLDEENVKKEFEDLKDKENREDVVKILEYEPHALGLLRQINAERKAREEAAQNAQEQATGETTATTQQPSPSAQAKSQAVPPAVVAKAFRDKLREAEAKSKKEQEVQAQQQVVQPPPLPVTPLAATTPPAPTIQAATVTTTPVQEATTVAATTEEAQAQPSMPQLSAQTIQPAQVATAAAPVPETTQTTTPAAQGTAQEIRNVTDEKQGATEIPLGGGTGVGGGVRAGDTQGQAVAGTQGIDVGNVGTQQAQVQAQGSPGTPPALNEGRDVGSKAWLQGEPENRRYVKVKDKKTGRTYFMAPDGTLTTRRVYASVVDGDEQAQQIAKTIATNNPDMETFVTNLKGIKTPEKKQTRAEILRAKKIAKKQAATQTIEPEAQKQEPEPKKRDKKEWGKVQSKSSLKGKSFSELRDMAKNAKYPESEKTVFQLASKPLTRKSLREELMAHRNAFMQHYGMKEREPMSAERRAELSRRMKGRKIQREWDMLDAEMEGIQKYIDELVDAGRLLPPETKVIYTEDDGEGQWRIVQIVSPGTFNNFRDKVLNKGVEYQIINSATGEIKTVSESQITPEQEQDNDAESESFLVDEQESIGGVSDERGTAAILENEKEVESRNIPAETERGDVNAERATPSREEPEQKVVASEDQIKREEVKTAPEYILWSRTLPDSDMGQRKNNIINEPYTGKFIPGTLTADKYGEDPYIYEDRMIDPSLLIASLNLEGKTYDEVVNMPTTQKYIEWYKQGHMPPPISVVFNVVSKSLKSTNRRRVIAAIEAGIKEIPARVEIGRASEVYKDRILLRAEKSRQSEQQPEKQPSIIKAVNPRTGQTELIGQEEGGFKLVSEKQTDWERVKKEQDQRDKERKEFESRQQDLFAEPKQKQPEPEAKSEAKAKEPKPEKQVETKTQKETEKIEDFGEKIGGARKDRQASINSEISDEEIASKTLSQIWPKQEIDDIQDNDKAAIATAIRGIVPRKPSNKYKLSSWVGMVKMVRTIMRFVEEKGYDFVVNKMKNDSKVLEQFTRKIELLKEIPRDQWDRIGKVQYFPDAYRYGDIVNGKAEEIPSPYASAIVDGRSVRASNMEELTKTVMIQLGEKPESQTMQFEVRGVSLGKDKKGTWRINKKGDPLYRPLKVFEGEDAKSAFAYIKNNYSDLVKAWEKIKESDNVKETDVRRKENKPRTAKDYRKYKDATSAMFMDTFGFRGVEFGNWVAQGSNRKERQGMLNEAFDALMDLSDILGIPPKAISLNGELALAFGSRGYGWASAHYEPDKVVINLTKTRGAGTLAHEWFHALDNYFQKKRDNVPDRSQDMITTHPEGYYENTKTGYKLSVSRFNEIRKRNGINNPDEWKKIEGVRPEVERVFADLVNELNKSPMAKRSSMIDKGKRGEHWSNIIERAARAFENYVIHKMAQRGYNNDYLANVISIENFIRDVDRYPYLKEDEIAPISDAFDNLFSTLKTKETDKGIALYGDIQGEANADIQGAQTGSRTLSEIREAIDGYSRVHGQTERTPLRLLSRIQRKRRIYGFVQRIAKEGRVADQKRWENVKYSEKLEKTDHFQIADRMFAKLGVSVVPVEGLNSGGMYDPVSKTVFLSDNNPRVFFGYVIHEATHVQSINRSEAVLRAIDSIDTESEAIKSWESKLGVRGRSLAEELVAGIISGRTDIAEQIGMNASISREAQDAVLASLGISGKSVTSNQDSEYLAAVERGDMATAQRMVDDAAKKAGYTSPQLFRGSVEDDGVELPDSFEAGSGIFLTDSADVAAIFTFPREHGEVVTSQYDEESGEDIDIEPGPVIKAYAKIDNPLVLNRDTDIDSKDFVMDTSLQASTILQAKKDGHDGIIVRDTKEGVGDWMEDGTTYVVFNSSQVKLSDPVTRDDQGRIIPLSERFKPESQDIRYGDIDPERPAFYSALTRAVESLPESTKMPADQFIKRLEGFRNKGQAWKNQEAEETGFFDWLKMQQENGRPITKADAVEFLNGNGVNIDVIEKRRGNREFDGKPVPDGAVAWKYADEVDGSRWVYDEYEAKSLEREGASIEWMKGEKAESSTKYSQYAPAGGSNYREVLLTVPVKSSKPISTRWDEKKGGYIAVDSDGKDMTPGAWESKQEAIKAAQSTTAASARKEAYTGPHWDEPNVIAHMLMQDRDIPLDTLENTMPDLATKLREEGKTEAKALHMIEGQSDLHAQGQAKGYSIPDKVDPDLEEYRNPPEEMTSAQYDDLVERLRARYNITDANTEEPQFNRILKEQREGVAPLPFKGEAWKRLVIRKMLSEAVKGNYDLLTWSTGADRADKWGSERVEWRASYNPSLKETSWTVAGTEQSGGEHAGMNLEQVARERGLLLENSGKTVRTKNDLRRIVEGILRNPESGKVDKLTDRIWDRMQTEPEGTSMPRKEFFEFLYDKSFVNEANDIVRKMDKSVSTSRIGQAEFNAIPITDAIRASVSTGQPMYGDISPEAFGESGETLKKQSETLDAMEKAGIIPPRTLRQKFMEKRKADMKIAEAALGSEIYGKAKGRIEGRREGIKEGQASMKPKIEELREKARQKKADARKEVQAELARRLNIVQSKREYKPLKDMIRKRPLNNDEYDEIGRLGFDKEKVKVPRPAGFIEKSVGITSDRLNKIDPELRIKIRFSDLTRMQDIKNDMKVQARMSKAISKMSEYDRNIWEAASKNADARMLKYLIKKYRNTDLPKAYQAARKLMKATRQRALEVGFDFGELKHYWPRQIIDRDGLMAHLAQDPNTSWVKVAMADFEEATNGTATDLDRTEFLNKLIRGYVGQGIPLSETANMKQRTIGNIDRKMMKFFAPSMQAFETYIHQLNTAIMWRKVFGGMDVESKNLLTEQRRLEKALANVAGDVEKENAYKAKLQNIRAAIDDKQKQSKYMNLESSLGAYLLEHPELTSAQIADLRSMLDSMYKQGVMPKFMGMVRDIGYIDMLGDFVNAMKQIQDLSISFYTSGVWHTSRAIGRAIAKRSPIPMERVGLDEIMYDLSGKSPFSKAVRLAFIANAMSYIDRIGKETLMAANMSKLMSLIKKGERGDQKAKTEAMRLLERHFGKAAQEAFDTLVGGMPDAEELKTRYAASTLADYQPTMMMEHPENYHKAGFWKIMYNLKAYQLKQLGVMRREIVDEHMKGNHLDATRNMIRLLAWGSVTGMTTAGLTALYLGLFSGKEIDPEDVFWAFPSLFGLNKYSWSEIVNKGPYTGLVTVIGPPDQAQIVDDLYRSLVDLSEGKEDKALQKWAGHVPIIGALWKATLKEDEKRNERW